jgi:hypothetical protein
MHFKPLYFEAHHCVVSKTRKIKWSFHFNYVISSLQGRQIRCARLWWDLVSWPDITTRVAKSLIKVWISSKMTRVHESRSELAVKQTRARVATFIKSKCIYAVALSFIIPDTYIEDIRRLRRDMDFMFKWQKQYLINPYLLATVYCSVYYMDLLRVTKIHTKTQISTRKTSIKAIFFKIIVQT